MREKIWKLAADLTGAGEAERPLLESLCAAAERAWRERLPQGTAPEDCGEAFCCAAAFTAAAELQAGRGGGEVEAFTAGDLSVRGKTGSERGSASAALRQAAERLMAPYAREERFSFRGVRG